MDEVTEVTGNDGVMTFRKGLKEVREGERKEGCDRAEDEYKNKLK